MNVKAEKKNRTQNTMNEIEKRTQRNGMQKENNK